MVADFSEEEIPGTFYGNTWWPKGLSRTWWYGAWWCTAEIFSSLQFPPFSTGEAKKKAMRGTGRREIWHGRLAEKALEKMIPSKEEFPYSIRVVSECLGSGGSTSMGSVCGST